MKKTFSLRLDYYFPFHVRFYSLLVFFTGLIFLFSDRFFASFLFAISSLPFWLIHYGIEVDAASKRFKLYTGLLGLHWGTWEAFQPHHYIFIVTSNTKQTMNLRVQSTSIENTEYDAFLKISDKQKEHLLSNTNKDRVVSMCKAIAGVMGVKVIDYSTGQAIEV